MPTVWLALKRTLDCKSEPSDVYEPKARNQLSNILTRKPFRSGCSRSIANLKDVINGNKRHLSHNHPSICSPRSIGSSDMLNPLTHQVFLNSSKRELKVSGGYGGGFHENGHGVWSSYVGAVSPGKPSITKHYDNPSFSPSISSIPRKSHSLKPKAFHGGESTGSSNVHCHRCGRQFGVWEDVEAHHLSTHAVSELVEGDSSRNIVEIICRTSWLKSENNHGRIERVVKVHNMQKTLARFEEYREMVKSKASKHPKKHPRCLADGNELLRFYGTIVTCSLGMNGSSGLCISSKCCVCRIIRHGFNTPEQLKDGIGVFTSSTSGRAFESIENFEENPLIRRALIVCRVIAGRVHKSLENLQEFGDQSGFDSLARKVGPYSNIEELYLLNPRALLPCFVVVCKPRRLIMPTN